MDRDYFKKRSAGRIQVFRPEWSEQDLFIRPVNAIERAKIMDAYLLLSKADEVGGHFLIERATKDLSCFTISCGLVDENGNRIYSYEDRESVGEDLLWEEAKELTDKILSISGIAKPSISDTLKNSNPTPSADSNSDLQPGSDGGTSTPS